MLETLGTLALAAWFAVLSRAAFHQAGLIQEGPVIRALRWGPLPYLILLSALDVDVEGFGRAKRAATRAYVGLIGVLLALASLAGVFIAFNS